MNIKGQGNSLSFIQGHSDSHFQTSRPIEARFHVDPPCDRGMKVCSNGLCHMTNMAAMPIYGKNLKKSSSLEPKGQWRRKFECSIGYFQVYSNDEPELTLTYFTARSNLIPYAFVWEKGKIMDFSETIVVYDIKVGRFSLLNEYMDHYEYQKSGSFIHWTSSKVTQIQHFQSWCRNPRPIEAKFHMEPPWDVGNENLFKCSRSHDHAHVNYGEIMTLKLGIQHRVLEY